MVLILLMKYFILVVNCKVIILYGSELKGMVKFGLFKFVLIFMIERLFWKLLCFNFYIKIVLYVVW